MEEEFARVYVARQAVFKGVAALVANALNQVLGDRFPQLCAPSLLLTPFVRYLSRQQLGIEVLRLGWEYLVLSKVSPKIMFKGTVFPSTAHSLAFTDTQIQYMPPWSKLSQGLASVILAVPQVFADQSSETAAHTVQQQTWCEARQRSNVEVVRQLGTNIIFDVVQKIAGSSPKSWGSMAFGQVVNSLVIWIELQLSAAIVHALPVNIRDTPGKYVLALQVTRWMGNLGAGFFYGVAAPATFDIFRQLQGLPSDPDVKGPQVPTPFPPEFAEFQKWPWQVVQGYSLILHNSNMAPMIDHSVRVRSLQETRHLFDYYHSIQKGAVVRPPRAFPLAGETTTVSVQHLNLSPQHQTCPVCQKRHATGDRAVQLQFCQHLMCPSCAANWPEDRCPCFETCELLSQDDMVKWNGIAFQARLDAIILNPKNNNLIPTSLRYGRWLPAAYYATSKGLLSKEIALALCPMDLYYGETLYGSTWMYWIGVATALVEPTAASTGLYPCRDKNECIPCIY